MNTKPALPTRVVNRELDRAVATTAIADYRFTITDGGHRRWLIIDHDGERRSLGPAEVAAFIDGIAVAEAAREEAVQ